jgi:hypothetical protein
MVISLDGWGAKEFSGLDLGDERLNKRAIKLVEQFADKPTASIPAAAGGWADTIAAYRFLGNENADWESILAPHAIQTQQRMSRHPVVLCLQDTTELDFNGQDIKGLGSLSYDAQRGMYLHPTYAITPQREPLGVTAMWMWARERRDESQPKVAIEKEEAKESIRWIKGYEGVAKMAATMSATRLVYVADRESDILALMQRADELGTPADWLVRAQHNRNLPDGEKLWTHTCEGKALGEIVFTMPARDDKKARQVRQQLWTKRVKIPAGKTDTIEITCIIAREVNAPSGVKPVEWRLLSNRCVPKLEDVVELIDWYRARWEIEMFFNVLKNGCNVEALQLSGIERLERALALFTVVAWRIAHLMRLGRVCPDMDAALFFHADEIRGAYLLTKKKRPTKPPTINQVLRIVAQLGGFLGRKGDGEPGVKTIWIGLQRVMDSAATIQALREED